MKRIAFLFVFMIIAFSSLNAKSYHFDMAHSYEVQIVRVAQQGTKFLKAWGVAGSPDKAIDMAMQDAVAACIFTGVEGNEIAGKIPPLLLIGAFTKSTSSFLIPFLRRANSFSM